MNSGENLWKFVLCNGGDTRIALLSIETNENTYGTHAEILLNNRKMEKRHYCLILRSIFFNLEMLELETFFFILKTIVYLLYIDKNYFKSEFLF